MRALDVMTRTVITVLPETTVRAAAQLFAENHISGAPVVEIDGSVIGIVTEGDLLRRIETGTETRRRSWWLEFLASTRDLATIYIKENARLVKDVMTPDVVSVNDTTPLHETADMMERHRVKRVPVMSDGKLVGIVSRANLVRALASATQGFFPTFSESDQDIREAIIRELSGRRWALHAENVIVNDGVVHLWGVISSAEQGRAMCVAAENVPGVKGVESHMDFPPIVPAM
jgi:CBS-domain-containing membrane protein